MPLDPESYVEPEVAVAAAVVAVAAAPSLRKVFRKSMVYGVAGVLLAYDKVVDATQKVVANIRSRTSKTAEPVPASEPAPTPAPAEGGAS